jgi:ABC-2 type transport system ATP-binding protein
VIELRGLSKSYGSVVAVDDLTVDVPPGRVTALLGRNGAGKSTTLRMVLGLDRPSTGTARIDGRALADIPTPLRTVGALLDSSAAHPGRTARNHLRWLAASNRLPDRRVGEVLQLVQLQDAAGRRIRGFSLGMRQRLGLAAALLGDPPVLLLDEPANGLDAEGIRWLRTFLRALAVEGRTVLVSSHLMAEVELTADHLLVIDHGRLLADTPLPRFLAQHTRPRVRVRTPQTARLCALVDAEGVTVTVGADGALNITGMTAEQISAIAARHGAPLLELSPEGPALEDAFLELTAGAGTTQGQERA